MCTAISLKTKDHYFGRNLDLEYSYNETITITPRNYAFQFSEVKTLRTHYAIIGVATIAENYPLYYDAVNEAGLCIAALNFPGNATYHQPIAGFDNIAPFELIPWLLGQCRCVEEAEALLRKVNLVNIPFSSEYPLTPLHWIIADRDTSIVAEPMDTGLRIHRNPVGVLTNNPPFDYHLINLQNYLNLTAKEATNRFSGQLNIEPYSRGMGGIGLPGDLSSASRFIRAAFVKLNSVCDSNETSSINQFFHILSAVEQQRGCVAVGQAYEITVYSCCCNTDKGIYYYKTYDNSGLCAVSLFDEDLDRNELTSYPLRKNASIYFENR